MGMRRRFRIRLGRRGIRYGLTACSLGGCLGRGKVTDEIGIADSSVDGHPSLKGFPPNRSPRHADQMCQGGPQGYHHPQLDKNIAK